jgi:hypothetical protein
MNTISNSAAITNISSNKRVKWIVPSIWCAGILLLLWAGAVQSQSSCNGLPGEASWAVPACGGDGTVGPNCSCNGNQTNTNAPTPPAPIPDGWCVSYGSPPCSVHCYANGNESGNTCNGDGSYIDSETIKQGTPSCPSGACLDMTPLPNSPVPFTITYANTSCDNEYE